MKKNFLLVVGLLYGLSLLAQDYQIPFEEDGLVFIEVSVNDHPEAFRFVFDTGASTSVINASVAKKLGMKANFQQQAGGASGVATYDVVTNQTLHVGKLGLTVPNLVMVDLSHLEERSGGAIDGIVGYDLITKFITYLDFDAKVINLYSNTKEVKDLASFTKISIDKYASIPRVSLQFTLKNGTVLDGEFLFDSGANSNLILNTPFVKKHNLETQIGKTYGRKHAGLTSTGRSSIGYVQDVTFGNTTFEDIPISLSNATAGVLSGERFAGILGAGIINRFHVVLDYKNDFLYLKPNNQIDKPFRHNFSGFSFVKKDGKVLIDDVTPNSQAATLGLEVGDELLALDSYTGKNTKLIREMLQKEGKITLRIKKESGEVQKHILPLVRLIQ